jgi:creatinine amidohydrolase
LGITDIIESVLHHGFNKIILVGEALKGITETGLGGTGHACELETSIIQLVADDLIDETQIQEGGNVPTFKWAEGDMLYGASAGYYRSIKEMTKNGVYGDPTKASVEKGKRITSCVIDSVEQIVFDLNSIKNDSSQ